MEWRTPEKNNRAAPTLSDGCRDDLQPEGRRVIQNPDRPGCSACLLAGERVDDLERSGLHIIQNPEKFCFGMDAVLLAGFARAKSGELCADLGCGNGIIPLLLSARTKGRHFTGLEIQEYSADLARRSTALNGLENRIEIVNGDLKDASRLLGASSFHVVTCNPPYMRAQHGLTNPNPAHAIARHELLCTLEDVIRESAALLMPGGRFYLVHRPFRLAEIITLMVQYRLEPKRMRLVYPQRDREPNMVLLEGIRGARPRMTVEKPLIVWESPGEYTREMKEDYGY